MDGAADLTRRSACIPGPPQPISLATLDDLGGVFGIVAFGDRLVVGGLIDRPIDDPQAGRFDLLSLTGGAITRRDVPGGIPVGALLAGTAVVYRLGTPEAIPGGWQFNYDHVIRWDLPTDQTLELGLPPGRATDPLASLAANPQGQIFWNVKGDSDDGIAMWDPATGESTLAVEASRILGVLDDASNLYWPGYDESYRGIISSRAISGGPVALLYVAPSPIPDGEATPIGIDEISLYYTLYADSAGGILAVPKTGGAGHTIVPNAQPSLALSFDRTHIYWVDQSDGSTLRRTPKTGGPTEMLWSGPNRWIQTITVDDCNVYWVAANPFEVFYRGR